VLASALKNGVVTEDDMMPAIEEAAALNAAAARVMQTVGAHACTDVSGFGLLGHLGEMLEASGVAAQLEVGEVPLHDGVLELIARQVFAGGLRANRDYFAPRVAGRDDAESAALVSGDDVDPRLLALFDPQTSGGLLIAVPGERRDELLEGLRAAGAGAWAIGEVVHGPAGRIALR
jgi:selenide, water dikinase